MVGIRKGQKLPRHPWDNWFSKNRFTLVQGRDFNCMLHTMDVQIRRAAASKGLTVSTSVNEDNHSILVEVD